MMTTQSKPWRAFLLALLLMAGSASVFYAERALRPAWQQASVSSSAHLAPAKPAPKHSTAPAVALNPAQPAHLPVGLAINKSVVAGGGGGPSNGSTIQLQGTAGQSAVHVSSGGGLTLSSGFWPDDSPPTISSNNLSVKAGSSSAPFTIAAAADPDQAANTLGITINGNPTTASSNGVTVSNVAIQANGSVTANIATTCAATTATFNLVVTDNQSTTGIGTLTVSVIANTPPMLSYDSQTIVAATTTTILPATGPSDNGTFTIGSASVSPNNGGLGVLINQSNGAVTLLNALLVGTYMVTVPATDNCGATTNAQFTVMVVCPTVSLTPASLPNTIVSAAYNQTISAAPAGGNYSFAVTNGLLPTGLTLNSNGSFSGAPTQSGTFNFRVTATGFGSCTGFRDYTLVVNNLTSNLGDPIICAGPGGVVAVTATVTNGHLTPQAASFTADLPASLLALPGTCAANVAGTCSVVNASTVTWSGTLNAGQTVTINYQAQIADFVTPGTQVCVTSTATIGGNPIGSVTACKTVNCPTPGPGGIFPAASEASGQGAGSVLIYNIYTSGATSGNTQNTRINLTNSHPSKPAFVHLFFVSEGCSVADSYVCLTGNQTTSFLASDLDPGTTGYLVAVAVDGIRGCPTSFNYLIGDEYVKFSTGHAANLGAEAYSQLAGGLPACDGGSVTSELKFDGTSYDMVSHVLADDSVGAKADGNDKLLILNRIGGNLGTGAGSLSSVFGVFYDDAENALSFTFSGGHQFRSSLSNNFPRITPRFETFIPAGRTGWFKVWPSTPGVLWGMTGAAINFNPNAASSSGAFNQGHNLHKLRLTNQASYVIPVFPPSC